MQLSRFIPRFTVRRLMVAVAIVALFGGIFIETKHRCQRFGKIAMIHWFNALSDANSNSENKQVFHTYMWAKYTRASRYPWLPVAPDPPEPE